jgi:hypothetical protein
MIKFTECTVEKAPKFYARITGILWLIVIVSGTFAQFIGRTPSIKPGDPATTVNNILSAAILYRLDLTADLISSVCYLALSVILYELFKNVNKTISLLAASFGLVGVVTGIVDVLNHFAPLVLMGNAQYLSAMNPEQLQTFAMAFLKLHGLGFTISLVFFGFHCLLIGNLIIRAKFMPRIIGFILMLAGIGYLINSFTGFFSSSLANLIFPFAAVCGFAGEGSITFWFLIFGLNESNWKNTSEGKFESI